MNQPQFKIYGSERRQLKKKLSSLKSFSKGFWRYHQLVKDIEGYDSGGSDYPMSDDAAQIRFNEINEQIKQLEMELNKTNCNLQNVT